MPWISTAKNFSIKAFYIWKDRGYRLKTPEQITTKCKTYSQYIDLYAGEEYKLGF